MNIFDIVPGNFFNILTSSNKEIYFECLKIIYRIYDKRLGFDVTKEEVIAEILAYFEQVDEEIKADDDGRSITKKERANYTLQKFEDCGWISIETSNDYVDMISFNVYALTLMETMVGMCDSENALVGRELATTPAFEYKGYLFSIYSLLTNRDTKEYGLMLKQVHRLAVDFMNEIKKINLKLRSYIDRISKQKEVKDLMELLIDYKTQLVDKGYQLLKTYDNIDRYKAIILELLEAITLDEEKMVIIRKEYIDDMGVGEQEANFYALNNINEIIDLFSGFDELLSDIELKNKIYVNSTITKVKFLLNNETDVLGKLNTILRYIKETKSGDRVVSDKLSPLFSIGHQEHITSESLYTPKGFYKAFEPTKIVAPNVVNFDNLENEFIQQYDLLYSEDKVINYVRNRLVMQKVIRASSMFEESPNEDMLLNLLYILVYSSTSEDYSIEILKEKYENDDIILSDFNIVRR